MRWLLIDRIEECDPGKFAIGTKTFSSSEPLFQDHFPGNPIVPGVLQVEMMAQLVGNCLLIANPKLVPVLSWVKSAKFFTFIRPEELCRVEVTIRQQAESYVVGEGKVFVGDQSTAEATLVFHLAASKLQTDGDYNEVVKEFLCREQSGGPKIP